MKSFVQYLREETAHLQNFPLSRMRPYRDGELDWEYDREYLYYAKGRFPHAFANRDDFDAKLDAAPLRHLTVDELRRLQNSTASGFMDDRPVEEKQRAAREAFGHRRDMDRIHREMFDTGLSAPIILKDGNRMYIMSGNTRMSYGAASNYIIPAKIIDVTGA